MTPLCPGSSAAVTGKSSLVSEPEALALLQNMGLAELMARAHDVRTSLHGLRTYMVHSLNINPTNICENQCKLCAFWREREDADAYVLNMDQVRERLGQARDSGLTDLHVVGGIIPELTLDYYVKMFRAAKEILPRVLIQGLTAVEIHYLAVQAGKPVMAVLEKLKEAGLDAIPGGGAEIFDPGVRERICSDKIPADTWLDVHEQAHGLGIPTNATMLFGHHETLQDRIDHLARLRRVQERTGGFRAFILLPFHPGGTRLDVEQGPSGYETIRLAATARIFLQNVPHLRVLANYMDRKLLEVLAFSGVDDIGGTSLEERIAKAAGAPDSHAFPTLDDMRAVVDRLGLQPVLVNSAYEELEATPSMPVPGVGAVGDLLTKARNRERLTDEEAWRIYMEASLHEMGAVAQACRMHDVPGNVATYVVDRNLSITNVCESGCRFCAFHVAPGGEGAFTLSVDEIVAAAKEAESAGATQLLFQGGLNPDLDLAFYTETLRRLKAETGMWLHALSPAEIAYMAGGAGLNLQQTLTQLREAGLDSLPGGGAEILVDDVRARVSPHKIGAEDWFAVMRVAHELGMKTTATMVYGLSETQAQRIEHLVRVRKLQDETGGFTAFIPWSFQSPNTQLDLPPQTGVDYLRVVAMSRIVLDNVSHIQAGWVTEGPDLAQLALQFGADDFGGVLMEERVVRATGVQYAVTRDDVVRLITATGMTPVQRTTQYDAVATDSR